MKGTLLCEAIVRTGMLPVGGRGSEPATCGRADHAEARASGGPWELDRERPAPSTGDERGEDDETDLDLELPEDYHPMSPAVARLTHRLTQAFMVVVWLLVLLVVLGVTSALSQVLVPPPSLPPPLTAWTPCEPTETPL